MNCHRLAKKDSPLLQPIRDSAASGFPVRWVRVHELPDYAYFNHAAHVHAGVGCVSCHGRIDQMEVVHQVKPLSMGWCLDCHRDPGPQLRPVDEVTNMPGPPPIRRSGRRRRSRCTISPSGRLLRVSPMSGSEERRYWKSIDELAAGAAIQPGPTSFGGRGRVPDGITADDVAAVGGSLSLAGSPAAAARSSTSCPT
jgi:hypothetical protein